MAAKTSEKKKHGKVAPPYGLIWDCLKDGSVVPFLGAGASFVGRPLGATWNGDEPTFLPSGIDLARFLADKAELPSNDRRDREDLAKVSSYYTDIAGRRRLREGLRKILNREYRYGPLHEFLAAVPTHLLIVVTNYDTLLEQAFRAAGKPYDLVIYSTGHQDLADAVLWWPHGAAEPQERLVNGLDFDLSTTTVIYKMHGTVSPETDKWDSFVITEEDYVEFLSRMTKDAAVPALFSQYFRERSFLFLGYSLRDWNLRVVLRNLRKYFSRRDEEEVPSWAIQYKPPELERRLWINRQVNIFDLTLDEFVSELHKRMGK